MLRLYSIVHGAMESTKTSHFTCQSKSFISIFFITQVSTCELQPFSCHDLQITYTHKLPVLCSSTIIGACHGKSYRIHSSSTDQRIWNPVSLESRIQDCLRLQGARYKILFGWPEILGDKNGTFKFQIRLVFRVKFKQTTWRAGKQVKIQPFSFNRNNLLQITGEIGDFGDMRWELVGTTLLSWVVVYLCLFKGIKSSGKVKYILR